jgi:hypothetical protein
MSEPKNARQTGKGRVYEYKGATYWSVTSIISGGLPKPQLVPWGMRVVAEYAVANVTRLGKMVRAAGDDPDAQKAAIDWLKGAPYRERDRASDMGSLIHSRIESLILGKPQPVIPPVARPQLDAFDAFVRDWHPTFEAAEFTVYNRAESYAGTGDWIATIPGLGRVLGDTKTGKDVYPEAALQLSAYRNGEFIGLADGTEAPMPQVDSCAVLHLRPDGYSLVPVVADEEVFRAFLFVREVFRFQESISRRVVGEALVPPDFAETFPEVAA